MEKSSCVVVIGGVNIDICGQSFAPLIKKDSNPGFSRTSLGGVGRNIAHNLALLDVPVCLLSAVGDDLHGNMVAESCNHLGIDFGHVRKVPDAHTSTYLFLNGPDGDMELAVSDMTICDSITPEYLEENAGIIQNAAAVVVDTNIPEESVFWVTQNSTAPVFADPVSVTKAGKLRSCLGKIHTLKPNRLEAQYLSGVEIRDQNSLEYAAHKLLDTGLERVFISMGGDGVYYADHQVHGTSPVCKAQLVNATGAGDAYMAGLVWAYLQEANTKESAVLACAASAIAIEGSETINPLMSVNNLLQRTGDLAGDLVGKLENYI